MEERGTVRGDVVVAEEYHLHGTIKGNVLVQKNGRLHLDGVVDGNVVIESGGMVYLHGTVNGDVTNRGMLNVAGMVNGVLNDLGGTTHIEPGAVINERRG